MIKIPRLFLLLVLSVVIGVINSCTNTAAQKSSSVQTLLIADNGFSGSSVNVLAGVKQTVFTSGEFQYAAFYNANAHLVLAKRALSDTHWQINETEFTANVHDAHNHISLVVDAEEYLHIAWDHHNSPLNYARSLEPGSLQIQKITMLSAPGHEATAQEHSLTYPQFYRLHNGDLLFAYRHGGSGRGNLVLNRYDLSTQKWHRLHNSLIDGEGKRSAYWDLSIDTNGVMHMAWIWRETPDVATNHDIAYAQSRDNGQSWQTLDGKTYKLPIVEATSQVVMEVPPNHKLMNPPFVTADKQSNPFITSYWADSPSDTPGFRIVHGKLSTSGEAHWQLIKAPPVTENFELSGHGTKKPPISRAVLLIDEQMIDERAIEDQRIGEQLTDKKTNTSTSNTQNPSLHLIYRDDFNNGFVMAASLKNLAKPEWQHRILVARDMGAWEPSLDGAQWHQHQQAHLLLQQVGQDDGNDAASLNLKPSEIELLMWKP